MSRTRGTSGRGRGRQTRRQEFAHAPRLGRQLIYAGLTLAAMLGGYWAGATGFGSKPLPWDTAPPVARNESAPEAPNPVQRPAPPAKKTPPPTTSGIGSADLQAWYTSDRTPPLIRAPEAPLFPDPIEVVHPEEPLRAYEEALPEEIHAPRSISVPMPPPPAGQPAGADAASTPTAEPPLEITVVQPARKTPAAPRPDVLNSGARGGLTPPPLPAGVSEPPRETAPEIPREPEAEVAAVPTEPETAPVMEEPAMEAPPAAADREEEKPKAAPSLTLTVTRHAEPEAPPPSAAPQAPEPAPGNAGPPEPEVAMLAEPVVPPPERPVPAWRRFAVAAPNVGSRPMIAVVIDDMGVDQHRSARVIDLEGPLTVSFLTYARNLEQQTLEARLKGHELMLHMPMEPSNPSIDPGPNVLLTSLSHAELEDRLDWDLSRFQGFVGVNNHMGSKFTADADGMAVVMQALHRRGLLFLDSRTTGATTGAVTALRAGVPFVERNVFLDNVNDVSAVNDRLADLENVARKHGFAVGIGHPRDATIEALADWVWGLKERGFVLVPLTTIVSRLQEAG